MSRAVQAVRPHPRLLPCEARSEPTPPKISKFKNVYFFTFSPIAPKVYIAPQIHAYVRIEETMGYKIGDKHFVVVSRGLRAARACALPPFPPKVTLCL